MSPTAPSIRHVALDDASIIRRSPEVEHERRIALVDLVHNNDVTLLVAPELVAPFDLFISVRENRLTLRFTDAAKQTYDATVPLTPFRRVIKDYFLMCESYYDAIKHAPGDRLQTLDMARRAVHNEGAEMLQSLLEHALAMDFPTARRLFTLMAVLHIK